MQLNVAYVRNGYPEKRMIIDKTKNNYIFLNRKKDIGYLMAKINYKITKKSDIKNYNRIESLYKPVFVPKTIDIIHTLNLTISTNKPWIVSTEYDFPLYYPEMKENEIIKYSTTLKKYILADNCKKILPFSECAKEECIDTAKKYLNSNELKKFKSKIQVVYPPQDLIITNDEIEKKFRILKEQKNINFVFVGRQFFRKGGYIALKSLEKIRQKYKKINFIIISSLASDGKAYNESYSKVEKEILNKKWIKWYKNLPNDKVLSILKKCHIGLLPTFGDTFGFSVLEMQACGCPVITSNNYALPEINNDNIGWICDINECIQKYGNNYFDVKTSKSTTDLMINKLTKIIQEIINTPKSNIESKAIRAFNNVKVKNSPVKYSEILNNIYIDALQ